MVFMSSQVDDDQVSLRRFPQKWVRNSPEFISSEGMYSGRPELKTGRPNLSSVGFLVNQFSFLVDQYKSRSQSGRPKFLSGRPLCNLRNHCSVNVGLVDQPCFLVDQMALGVISFMCFGRPISVSGRPLCFSRSSEFCLK